MLLPQKIPFLLAIVQEISGAMPTIRRDDEGKGALWPDGYAQGPPAPGPRLAACRPRRPRPDPWPAWPASKRAMES
jgi:hypothetical protein